MGKNTQQKTSNFLDHRPSVVREFSSGGVVFKKVNGSFLWLVRKTTASKLYPKQYWMFPKGRIDDTDKDEPGPMAKGLIKADEKSLQKAAIKEVSEEGGIKAEIVNKVGTLIYSFTDPNRGKILKFSTFYLMEWKNDLPEGFDKETEEVLWLDYDGAHKKLSFSGEKDMLKKAQLLLVSTT